MKKYYKLNKEKFLNYIQKNFNIDKTSYLLIECITNYFINSVKNYESFYYNDIEKEIYLQIFINDLISILNNCDIDITILELLKNDVIEVLKNE